MSELAAEGGERIYPTHTCFDDVTEYMNMLAKAGAPREVLLAHTIVHGVLVAPTGERLAHAWIEHEGNMIEGGIFKGERVFVEFSVEEFRAFHQVEDETRYSIVDTVRLEQERGFPPWEERYRALCGRNDHRTYDVGFRVDVGVLPMKEGSCAK